jgi:tripartite-type tricarboxylate transporter receptor subunit TctC
VKSLCSDRPSHRHPAAAAFAAASLITAILGVASAHAQGTAWPAARPIRWIVPYVAGGTPDFMSRALLTRLGELVGQQFIIDNRPGAGGNIGTEAIAKAAPDGYTIGIAAVSPFAINIALYGKRLPFDPNTDFEYLGLIATSPLLLIAHPSLPVRTVKDVVALARSKPGQLSYGSAGNGTSNHLVGEMFKAAAGVDVVHIPFKGTSQSLLATIGGEIELLIGQIPSTSTHVRSGKVRPIAVTSAARSPVLPEVPTFLESGVRLEAASWYGAAAPRGTPREIVARLNAEIGKALAANDVRTRFLQEGATTEPGTPEQFVAFMRAEQPKWAEAVRLSKAKLD